MIGVGVGGFGSGGDFFYIYQAYVDIDDILKIMYNLLSGLHLFHPFLSEHKNFYEHILRPLLGLSWKTYIGRIDKLSMGCF